MHGRYKKEKKNYDMEWKIEFFFLLFVFKVESYPPQGSGLPSHPPKNGSFSSFKCIKISFVSKYYFE